MENHEGNRTTPSVAALSKSGERLVELWQNARPWLIQKIRFSVKRLIGRSFDVPEIQRDKRFPFDIQKSATGGVEIKMGDRWYKPEEISAMILAKLKADAEAKLGEK